jgi:cephalosporin hydroxylase
MIGLEELFGQPEVPKIASPKDVAKACDILIQHVLSTGCGSAIINVGSEEGGSAIVTVKIIDCGHGQDTQESST